jgi:lipoprotein
MLIKYMKKKNLLVIILLNFLFGGCNNEDLEYNDETRIDINLTAPNGQKIAESVESLTNLIAEVAEEAFGENKDIKIDDVIYHDTDQGFIAEVAYITYDGYSKNVIIANTLLENDLNVAKIKSHEENGSEVEVTIYSCKSTNGKKCSECVVVASDYGVSCMCQRGESDYCDLHERPGKF